MNTPEVLNTFGQPIGAPVESWALRALPTSEPMRGRFCRLERTDPARDAHALFEAFALDEDARHWTYLPYGPWDSAEEYETALGLLCSLPDTTFYTIFDEATGAPVGVAAYLRIDPANGTIEVGHLRFSSLLQKRPAATEAMYLMMRHAFDDLGYRRYEWKCDSRNAPSVAAARRLGFRFEGVFLQAMVVKGRNRDTAWLSIIDAEWPAVRAGFEAWLAPGNFDAEGRQKAGLAELRGVDG
jgi:RimJ/RimL family protein N-acetyltransferase